MTVTLKSDDADAYLYLRQGDARSGTALNDHAADDDAGGGRNAQVQETLARWNLHYRGHHLLP